ncbi:hypothetical protein P7H43_01495 [Enterococcus asini]|uniref:Uncharacterized protein n=1 Tax=Enterococcus asini TaxID=57732 RepID=A0AAW8TSQ6_9ENTE|nr:hypothetical protein [Enterococcus asini]MDT2809165.1 hypothetical protein [Enterococcus asini]
MDEIIFEKSKKNLKKVYNRINSKSLTRYMKMDGVLFLAIGGYNRTFELLLEMGLERDEIATFSNLALTQTFINETHEKQVVYIRKINYLTSVNKGDSYSKKWLDLNVADGFEESMMIYKNAERTLIVNRKKVEWSKPSIVILDDQSLNLQFDGHRFLYQTEVGFVQIRNRNAEPSTIIAEIKDVEEAEKMMFALYQDKRVDESEVLDALNRIRTSCFRKLGDAWCMKPTEFKKVVGSQKLANAIKEMPELEIYQMTSNKKIGKDNARWIVIPESAFEFKGFDYLDEDELFEQELQQELTAEEEYAQKQEQLLQSIMSIELPINIRSGYVGSQMSHSPSETLQSFLDGVDDIENEKIHGIELLQGATTDEEYKHIKKYNLAYFLDGVYANNEREDKNYQGGKRLIAIDVDDGEYERSFIEQKLEGQGLFGLIYPTAKNYYDESKRWRIILMADAEMSKAQYREVVAGVAAMLDLEIDEASKKISQLMGYPLSKKDVSIVIGSTVNVAQFQPKPKPKPSGNVVDFSSSTKSLIDFNHEQAKLLKSVLQNGAPVGSRNETYRQIYLYLKDTLENPQLEKWHEEAEDLIEQTKTQAILDGLPEKEVEVIYR